MYCTQSDLTEQISEDKLIQLTDDNDIGIVDTSVIDRAITDADAEIDAYCGKRYSVPLSPTPAIIRKYSVDIAIYNLFSRRRGAPEERETNYNNAIKFLTNVSKGLITLGADDPDTPPSDTHKPEIVQSDRVFSRETLKGW